MSLVYWWRSRPDYVAWLGNEYLTGNLLYETCFDRLRVLSIWVACLTSQNREYRVILHCRQRRQDWISVRSVQQSCGYILKRVNVFLFCMVLVLVCYLLLLNISSPKNWEIITRWWEMDRKTFRMWLKIRTRVQFNGKTVHECQKVKRNCYPYCMQCRILRLQEA